MTFVVAGVTHCDLMVSSRSCGLFSGVAARLIQVVTESSVMVRVSAVCSNSIQSVTVL